MLRLSSSSKQISAQALPLAYLVNRTRILLFFMLLAIPNLYVVDSMYRRLISYLLEEGVDQRN